MRVTTLRVYQALGGLLLLMLLLPQAGWLSCTSPANTKPLPTTLRVFHTNETENELYRCGCKAKQLGGLSRRATVINQETANPILLVDAGNFSAKRPESEYDLYKESYLLKIYDMLQYDAVNVGRWELRHGKAGLETIKEVLGERFISANVTDTEGNLVLPPYVIAEVEGLKVGIIGLTTETFAGASADASPDLKTPNPITAFETYWAELKSKSDLQVLLSQLRDDEVDLLTKKYPELDLVIGGPGWNHSGESTEIPKSNDAFHAKVGQRGKYLGSFTIELDTTDRKHVVIAKAEGAPIELGDSVEENEQVESVLAEFKENLRNGTAPYQDIHEPHMEGAQFVFAGSINCQECHGAIYAGYLRTRHAQAFQTLTGKGEQNNDGCLECHTTAFSATGGYAQKNNSYLLANVGCESCHGAAADHAALASEYSEGKLEGAPADWKVTTTVNQDTCIQCHNPDNDPHWKGGVWPYADMVKEVGCTQWTQGGAAATTDPTGATVKTPTPGIPENKTPPPAAGSEEPGHEGHNH